MQIKLPWSQARSRRGRKKVLRWVQLKPFSCEFELFFPFTPVLCAAGDYFPACDLEGDNHRQDRLRVPVAISPKAQFLAEIGEYFYQAPPFPGYIYIYIFEKSKKKLAKRYIKCKFHVFFLYSSCLLHCLKHLSHFSLLLYYCVGINCSFVIKQTKHLLTCCMLGFKQMWFLEHQFYVSFGLGSFTELVRKKQMCNIIIKHQINTMCRIHLEDNHPPLCHVIRLFVWVFDGLDSLTLKTLNKTNLDICRAVGKGCPVLLWVNCPEKSALKCIIKELKICNLGGFFPI